MLCSFDNPHNKNARKEADAIDIGGVETRMLIEMHQSESEAESALCYKCHKACWIQREDQYNYLKSLTENKYSFCAHTLNRPFGFVKMKQCCKATRKRQKKLFRFLLTNVSPWHSMLHQSSNGIKKDHMSLNLGVVLTCGTK